MTDIIVDGKTKVTFVAGAAAPTSADSAATIGGGTDLQSMLVPTGLEGFEGSTAEVDSSALDSTFNTNLPGRTSFSGTNLVLKKQDGTDAVFDTLSVAGTSGTLYIRDGVDSDTDWATGDDYEAYPVKTGEFNYVGRGEANSVLRYRVPTPISAPRVRGTAVA